MKKGICLLLAVFFVMLFSAAAFAANSLSQGSKGISFGFGDSVLNHVASPTDANQNNPIVDISMRFFAGNDMALTAGVGFQMNTGDLEGTYLAFNIGIRKYLKTEDFAPFVAGQLSYVTYDAELPPLQGGQYVDFNVLEASVLFGAEYFFSRQFSVEGSLGVALGKAEDDLNNLDTTYLGTKNLGVRANFYF